MTPRRSNPAFDGRLDSCKGKSPITSPVRKLNRTASPTCVTEFVVVTAPRKSVYFCEVVKVLARILHINDSTEQEIVACWYNDDECQATMDDVAQCSSRILEQDDETDDFCRRGLEFRTPRNAKQNAEKTRKLDGMPYWRYKECNKNTTGMILCILQGCTTSKPNTSYIGGSVSSIKGFKCDRVLLKL
jgi:hypothetical protein